MSADNIFGPQRAGVLDFTILFEQSILSLLPTGLFILLVPLRLYVLWSNERATKSKPLLWAKMAIIAIYACLQTALLVLWCRQNSTKTAIAEPVLGLIESFALAALSFVEHLNSRKPSKLIGAFLVITIILDIALVRTFWIRSMHSIASVFTASFVIKTILLILEETPKSPLSDKEKIQETASGVVNRSFFWWLNGLFLQGHRTILETEDLQAIDSKFDTDHVSTPLEKQWERARNSGQPSLLKSTFLAYKWQFAAGIIPRLLHSGFNFAQPFLIQSVIVLVSKKEMSVQTSSGLIGATVLIYIGLAISGAWHKHMSYQLVTMYRGGLVSLIFKKTLKLKTTSIKDSAPVTLMTADVETIVAAGASVHDMWANMLELPVGIYLLYRQVGKPSLLVLVPTVITTIVSGVISPAMEPATVKWNEAVQKRVGETSSMLNQMKGIKMMGLTDFFLKMVQGLRVHELKVSAKFRWLLVYFNALAMISAQLTPVVVIMSAIYWTKADGGLSVAEAFTSLSLISVVTQPLVMILVSLMQIAGVVGGSGRIQAFLLLDEQLAAKEAVDVDAVTIQNVSIQTPDGNSLLTNINLQISPGTLNMLVGRVGCGKSSLLRTIIGELIPSEGTVKTQDSLAYCDQVPWLRNTTIRENVVGLSPMDDKWLSTVLHACALEEDLHQLPQGQETIVGSGGVALSGGQKQRVALARAVYSRKKLIVLDDVFSSLDKTTADAVFHRLLGAEGLLRSSTVVLVTIHYLPFADFVSVIEEGRITRNQVQYSQLEATETLNTIAPIETQQLVQKDIVKLTPKREIDLARKTGDTDCYKIYVKSMGWKVISIIFPTSVIGAVLEAMPREYCARHFDEANDVEIWLRIWTEKGEGSKDAHYAGGYIGLVVASMALALLNIEFSQDMTLIDMSLPLAFYLTLDLTLRCLVQVGVVASGASYFGAFLPISILALYLIQKYYLRTSRQMRLLDLEAKTPLYTQFTEITAGLATIRSFGWTNDFLAESFRMLNTSQKPFYLMFCIQRWLELVLDLFVAGMAILLVTIALRIPGTTSEGAIGLAMVNLLGLNLTLTTVIDQWTTLETSLGAIARLKSFISDTPNENKSGETEVPDNWPGGRIVFDEVTASYSDESQPVLRDVSLAIEAGQKVCVCGRTGSGKSSFMLSILRLLELQSGSIHIDGKDLASIPRQHIRSQITTIPQDPVSLTGTVRQNLDPEALIQADEILIEALKKTTLWATIDTRGGLDADLSELGFSVGQRQLFCLARALLSHSNIVLLDEPTSSVDNTTDKDVRHIIREVMQGRTVIEVTHRLDYVTDFDLAVVMKDGRVIETGDPRELLVQDSALKVLRG
ncbi:related to multidrug resistance-associated protein [Fusarium fujikuroi IMI 58289]|uniref:Related to multidrug resistance-associated protein n=1 Tax=Gibberella fujikuroi (strain CBS 195.34 / IMI 58289 / NRRL A-6831) TaxID=1279085 RepID=S0EBV3_GIBF5|nr:related to multidrug resistance-associated protein [Fusarium fujikuroi IMI 58289]CCT72090.1 related to multidrug resistance-associated protein [Fusarium fujikuroi IMI 58289]SCO18220.1 related to multidrug resistance-associated protein [Fusarium fujikuroi]